MEEKEQATKPELDEKAEQQIRLEQAKKERIEAETKKAKQKAREKSRQERKDRAAKVPLKFKLIGVVIVIVVVAVVCGFVLPYLLDDHETHYTSESDLKEAVAIENLSAIDYVYRGIAEKPGHFLWMDSIDYRVRYEAHVRAYYNMNDIEFTMDDATKTVTAYLPDAEIGQAKLDETKFGYLPEDANADMPEILALCREDAANDLNTEQVQKEANENLQNIVKGLTLPLLGDEWTMDFKSLTEYEGGDGSEAE